MAASFLLAALLISGCGSRAEPYSPPADAGAPATSVAGAVDAEPGRPLSPAQPVRLRIPSIGVDTGLIDLGLQSDGTMEVYGDVDSAQLRLITCGGEFDTAAHSYRDNIVCTRNWSDRRATRRR